MGKGRVWLSEGQLALQGERAVYENVNKLSIPQRAIDDMLEFDAGKITAKVCVYLI